MPDARVSEKLGLGQHADVLPEKVEPGERVRLTGQQQHRTSYSWPVVDAHLLGVPGPVQRVAQQDQATERLVGGDHAADSATKGMTTDNEVGRRINTSCPGVSVDQLAVDRDRALCCSSRQADRSRVEAALRQRFCPGPDRLDVA